MNRGALYYLMGPLLLFLALLQSTTVARFKVAGVKPDLVLLMVVIGALVYGARPGVLWAFIAGIGLDLFSGGPFGASSLALMASALVASLGHRPFSRFNILVPLSAAALGTLIYAAVYLATLGVLEVLGASTLRLPIAETIRDIVLPVTVYNTALMFLALPFLNRLPESQDL
ncbi:MAG: rod shape-determining protein MreD [Chloroflexota bacterium]|jgi:rod shape-determining protein MreD|nr:rod shape-determining protein MreD [Caldilinea sp.]GIK73511.1 MAG: rod shape-determining protein MreD [Chloroflexota bacterium]